MRSRLGGGNVLALGILAGVLVAIIIAVTLVPFLAFVEVSRLMEPGELARILFTRGPRDPDTGNP
jgi:hypothetical protein